MANQRVRDPVHDLIVFDNSELERTLWQVVQTRPFQRLRRVKQLGFSELVYPGASHSRLVHSIGVFHVARQLMAVVHRHVREESKEQRALAAALVHDLGHGPFSHAFEAVGKRLGLKLASHEAMSDELIRHGEVSEVLNSLGSGFANDVANIIKKDGVKSVQHAVVSSQFDADRLDYIQRDRTMTGTQHSAIDFTWLIANLEIGDVPIGVDDEALGTIGTFVIGPKAIYAAEAFVLGLFQLYPTVYFHKATRGAEKLFVELMVHLIELVRDGAYARTGLPANHPLIKFASNPDTIDLALDIDDGVVWGALSQMCEADDPTISTFARRLRDRKLYKCIDIRELISNKIDPRGMASPELILAIDRCGASIKRRLEEESSSSLLLDYEERTPYKSVSESKGPLDRINLRTTSGALVDLKERSSVVAALKRFKLFRAYVDRDDTATRDRVQRIVEEEIKICLTKQA